MEWETDHSRKLPVDYVLGPIERSYILEGDAGTYSKVQREKLPNKIEEKAGEIPLRFQDLIDDLALFYMYETLDAGDWGAELFSHDLSELYLVDARASKLKELDKPDSKHADLLPDQFGFELGCAIRLIFEANDVEEEYEDFLWGIISSEIMNATDDPSEQKERFEDLMSKFEQCNKEQIGTQTGVNYLAQEFSRWNQEVKQASREILIDAEFNPTDEKIDTLKRLADISASDYEFTEDQNQALRKALDEKETTYRLIAHLEEITHQDSRTIHDKSLRGVPANQLIKILFAGEYHSKTGELVAEPEYSPIFEEINDIPHFTSALNISIIKKEFSVSQKHVSTALGYLAGKYDRATWPAYPLVEETDKGDWQLTGYGKVAC